MLFRAVTARRFIQRWGTTTRSLTAINSSRNVAVLSASFQQQHELASATSLLGAAVVVIGTTFGMLSANTSITKCEESGSTKATERRLAVPEEDATTSTTTTTPPIRKCGPWCAHVKDDTTPCLMDTTIMPCQGSFCQTTAALWNLFVLEPRHNQRQALVSCDCYKAGSAYPLGGVPCDLSCLIPEVYPKRYPAPTGLGILCLPFSCKPGNSPRHAGKDAELGHLQCPCNWFGSECTNDWMTVSTAHVLKEEKSGTDDRPRQRHLQLTVLDPDNKLLAEDRPGSVVRLQRYCKETDTTYEMACAVANRQHHKNQTTTLEVILVAPDPKLDKHVRNMAEFILDMPFEAYDKSIDTKGKFHANPLISGFYNSHYTFLWDFMKSQQQEPNKATSEEVTTKDDGTEQLNNDGLTPVQDIVLVATGSGISGVMSVIEHAQKTETIMNHRDRRSEVSMENEVPVRLHVYYGVRDRATMPFGAVLEDLAVKGLIRLTVVESSKSDANDAQKEKSNEKVYVQHVVKRELEPLYSFASKGTEPVFVACGNYQMLDEMRRIVGTKKATTKLFLNI